MFRVAIECFTIAFIQTFQPLMLQNRDISTSKLPPKCCPTWFLVTKKIFTPKKPRMIQNITYLPCSWRWCTIIFDVNNITWIFTEDFVRLSQNRDKIAETRALGHNSLCLLYSSCWDLLYFLVSELKWYEVVFHYYTCGKRNQVKDIITWLPAPIYNSKNDAYQRCLLLPPWQVKKL